MKLFNGSQVLLNYKTQSFIFHLADPKLWEDQLQNENYLVDSLEKEGFIHASTSSQVEDTYRKYYSAKESMVLLTIVPNFLSAELKYEFSQDRNESFPHIFGSIHKTAIIRLQYYSAERNSDFRLA